MKIYFCLSIYLVWQEYIVTKNKTGSCYRKLFTWVLVNYLNENIPSPIAQTNRIYANALHKLYKVI